jgi:Rod binding domain-containing protein
MTGAQTIQVASNLQAAQRAYQRATAEQRIRKTLGQALGNMFYGTMLKQLRSSSLQGTYGHGGHGERVFQAQFDQTIAERMGEARGHLLDGPWIDGLVEQQTRWDQARQEKNRTWSVQA